MASKTTKNDWNIISKVYKEIFSTLILESKNRLYWSDDNDVEDDTALKPSGWDDLNNGDFNDEGTFVAGSNDSQNLSGVDWTLKGRSGLLTYIKTFQSRFYPVRGGDMEHNSLYPFVFLTFVEQGNDSLHSHPNLIENQTDLGIVIMQYNDGDVNLQGETFWLDATYTNDEIGYSSTSSDNSFIKDTQKGIVEIIEDVKSLLYNKHRQTRFGLKNVDWTFNGVTDPTLTSLQPLLLSPYIEAKQINLRVNVIENRNVNQLS